MEVSSPGLSRKELSMDTKNRKPFNLYNQIGRKIGHGIVYLSPDFTALQMQLADVLHLTEVFSFRWVTKNTLPYQTRLRRERMQDKLVEVKRAGYQIFRTGIHENGIPTETRWQVNDPNGVPLPTLYKQRTRAITAALKHLRKQRLDQTGRGKSIVGEGQNPDATIQEKSREFDS